MRGVATRPDHLLITSGITQAVVLLARSLRRRGIDAIAVEDPCFGFHRQAISNAGLRVVPVSVDDDGIDVAKLLAHNVRAVLVAPAHSYPMGSVLSATRRSALVKWAHDNDGLIIEDDYDAEFRYDRAPIGALQGLAPHRVAYAGCASKTLAPALRLGWLALPDWLIDDVVMEKLLDDMGSTVLEQWRWRGSSNQADWHGICGECARSTGADATPRWRRSPDRCRARFRRVWPRDCTPTYGCRVSATRSNRSTPRARTVSWWRVRAGTGRRPRPPRPRW